MRVNARQCLLPCSFARIKQVGPPGHMKDLNKNKESYDDVLKSREQTLLVRTRITWSSEILVQDVQEKDRRLKDGILRNEKA